MVMCLCCFSLQLSGQVFDPTKGSTHYGNGTTYHSNAGRNGAVTTKESIVDCATFPELCRGLLEEADELENPRPEPAPTEPKDPKDPKKPKDPKEPKKPKKQSYSGLSQEDQAAIEEYYEIYQAKSGVWFRQKGGQWFRVNDHSAHTAKLIGLITKK